MKPVQQHLYGIGHGFCLEGDDNNITVSILCLESNQAFPEPVTTWLYRDSSGTYPLPSETSERLTVPITVNDTVLIIGPASVTEFNFFSAGNAVVCEKINPVGRVTRRTIFRTCGES